MNRYRFPSIEVSFELPLTNDHKRHLEIIAGNRFLRNGKLLLPHHTINHTAQMLERLGLSISAAQWRVMQFPPISWETYKQYFLERKEVREWVLDGFLTEFQIDAVEKTGEWCGAHLWHPTGAGKTLTGILWALLKPGPVIIVTRAASRLQYGREIERFTHVAPYVIRPVSHYSKKKQASMQTLDDYITQQEGANERIILVLGWEVLTTHADRLCGLGATTIIYDESHRGKSSKRWEAIPLPIPATAEPDELSAIYREQSAEAKRRNGFIADPSDPKTHRAYDGPDRGRVMLVPAENTTMAASRLSKAVQRVLCTTATPIKDRVRDLWAQLDLAEPYAWGSKTAWMKRYCDAKPGQYGGLDTRGSSNIPELRDRLTYCTHTISYYDTHRQLPEKRRQSVYIAPEDQCRPSAGFPKELKAAAKRGATAVLEVRLAQAASKKRKAVLGLVSDHVECGHKIIIFTGRRRDVEALGEHIRKNKVVKQKEVMVWAAHGGTNANERDTLVSDYMAHPGPCVLVGTGHAFGESLNLQDTDAALFTMLPYTPGQLRQWEGRFTRLGQKRPVVIYYVIAEGTADERVADILISKMPAVATIAQDEELAAAKQIIAGLDDEEALAESILEKIA